MKKTLSIAILSLTMLFGTASFALATSVTDPSQVLPAVGDVVNDNGLINANKSGVGVGTNDGSKVVNGDDSPVATDINVIKSTDMNSKFLADGTPIVEGAQVISVKINGAKATADGNINVIITATGLTGSPKTIVVAVKKDDTPNAIATKIIAALKLDADVSAQFVVDGANPDDVKLIQKAPAIDATMNIAIADGNGLTYVVSAVSTVASEGVQRTHGEYQNNTNSCASCHQTHTGASDNLLFKSGVYETCTACHDGTLGFYNVFTGSTAGTFGGSHDGNASIHLATGLMEVKAAPGGNMQVATNGTSGTDGLGEHTWTGEFTCSSCHAPHGSYSSRLLHYNPNGIASVPMKDDATGSYTGTPDAATGGNMVRDIVVAAIPVADETSPAYVVYQTTAADAALGFSAAFKTQYGLLDADKVVVVMKKIGDGHATAYSYVRDTNPWIFGGEYKEDHSYKVNFTKFYPAAAVADLMVDVDTAVGTGDPQITVGLTFNYQQAFAKITGALKDKQKVANVSAPNTYATLVGTQADISRAFVVNLAMDPNIAWFGAVNSGVKITQVSPAAYSTAGNGIAVSQFCAACHTDYFTGSDNAIADGGTGGTGVWSKAFRHSTNSDNYTCLKCHFAHGTDVTVMMDAQDRGVATAATVLFGGDTAKATAYLLDKNPSSALKRYTNMSVCWKCHTSSHSVGLMNNNYVNNVKYDADTTNDLTNGFTAPANSVLPYFKAQTDIIKQPQ